MPKKREHGTGTVCCEERRRKWIGRVQVGTVDGRRRWREVSAPTRKEVSELQDRLRNQVATNTHADGRQKVGDYLDWLSDIVAPVRNTRTLASISTSYAFTSRRCSVIILSTTQLLARTSA